MVQAVLDYIFCKSNNSLIWKQSTVCKYSFLIHPTYTPSFPHVPSGWCLMKLESFLTSHFRLFPTQWTVARQVPLSWNPPGKNTGVGCHSLLQGIFPTQVSNPGILHCRQILYHLSHQGSPTQQRSNSKSDLQTFSHDAPGGGGCPPINWRVPQGLARRPRLPRGREALREVMGHRFWSWTHLESNPNSIMQCNSGKSLNISVPPLLPRQKGDNLPIMRRTK